MPKKPRLAGVDTSTSMTASRISNPFRVAAPPSSRMEGRPWWSTIFASPSSSQREGSGGTAIAAGGEAAASAAGDTAHTAHRERSRIMSASSRLEALRPGLPPPAVPAGSAPDGAARLSHGDGVAPESADPALRRVDAPGDPAVRRVQWLPRMADPLAPYFLGAYGENNDFFEKTLLELVRDHVFWRRNFHPEDEPPIGTHDQYTRAYLDGLARTRHELHQLTAALKRSIPSFHPRYLGHMVSDLLLPGLIAQLVTTLYNPNNIVEDVAPITVQLELEVGRQLATMLGFSVDPATEPCALGHLTSGGTVANDEALWLARSTRLYPLALRDASAATGAWVPDVPVTASSSDVELLALGVDEVLALGRRVAAFCARDPRGG